MGCQKEMNESVQSKLFHEASKAIYPKSDVEFIAMTPDSIKEYKRRLAKQAYENQKRLAVKK